MERITTLIDLLLIALPLFLLAALAMREWARHGRAMSSATTQEEQQDLLRRLIKRMTIQSLLILTLWVVVYAFLSPHLRPTKESNRVMTHQVQGEFREMEKRDRLDPESLTSGGDEVRQKMEDATGAEEAARKRQEMLDKVHKDSIEK